MTTGMEKGWVVNELVDDDEDESFTTAITYRIAVHAHNRAMTEAQRFAVRRAVQEAFDILSVKVALVAGHAASVVANKESSTHGYSSLHTTGRAPEEEED